MATPTGVPVPGAVSGEHTTVDDFTGPFAAPVQVAGQNPNRLYLLVFFSNPTGIVAPAPGSKTLGFGPDVSGQAGGRLIHRASVPGLIEGEWYGYDSGGGVIRVYDVGTA